MMIPYIKYGMQFCGKILPLWKIVVCVYNDREHTPETYNPEYNITTLPENSYRCVKFWCVNIRPGKLETYDDLDTCNPEYNFPEKFYHCGKFWCVYMMMGNPESYDDPETHNPDYIHVSLRRTNCCNQIRH